MKRKGDREGGRGERGRQREREGERGREREKERERKREREREREREKERKREREREREKESTHAAKRAMNLSTPHKYHKLTRDHENHPLQPSPTPRSLR